MFARVTEPTLVADGAYLRRGHAWRLLGHLATAGLPKKLAAVTTFRDGETLDVPGRPRVLHTPGHTAGHVCFWLEPQGVLVAGDLLRIGRATGPT
jgi:glyoxylase-like metal-dependent hydrolase (beta-lactamase superfamily II)